MNKATIYAIGAFLLLGGFYAATELAPDQSADPAWSIPAVKDTADAIEIVREGKKIRLEKSGENWSLKDPIDFPASAEAVKGVLDLFEAPIGVDLKIPVKAEELSRYELEADKAIQLTFFAAGKELTSFGLGKAVGKRTFVLPKGELTVYRAKKAMKWKVDKEARDWREKKIFQLDRDDVAKLVLHHPAADGGPITLERDKGAPAAPKEGDTAAAGDGWADTWRVTAPVAEKTDKSTVSSMLGSLLNLRAADFADDVAVADAGFTPDSYKLEVHPKPGKGDPVTVVFGAVVGENHLEGKYKDDYFLMHEGTNTVYVVRQYANTNLRKGLPELRDKEMFPGLKREQISGLTLQHGDTEIVFGKTGDDWKATKPAELADALDMSPLNSLLSSLTSLRAAAVMGGINDTVGGFTPDARKGRVTITRTEGEPIVLLIGGMKDEEKKEWFARRENAPDPVWVIRDYTVRQMTKDVAGFKKKPDA